MQDLNYKMKSIYLRYTFSGNAFQELVLRFIPWCSLLSNSSTLHDWFQTRWSPRTGFRTGEPLVRCASLRYAPRHRYQIVSAIWVLHCFPAAIGTSRVLNPKEHDNYPFHWVQTKMPPTWSSLISLCWLTIAEARTFATEISSQTTSWSMMRCRLCCHEEWIWPGHTCWVLLISNQFNNDLQDPTGICGISHSTDIYFGSLSEAAVWLAVWHTI